MTKSSGLDREDYTGCPVYGKKVTLHARYVVRGEDDVSLVEFSCDKQGRCGISTYDPCPMYVVYLEHKFHQ